MGLRVVHVSDSHVKVAAPPEPLGLADGVRMLRGESTLDALRTVVDHLVGAGPVDLVVHTGDLTDDGTGPSTDAALAELARVDAPLMVVPGNHDDATILRDRLGLGAGPQVLELGGWTFVGLNSAGVGREHGELGAGQLAALDRVLEQAAGPVAAAMHHPPISACPHEDCRLEDAEALLHRIDGGAVRLVLTGHLHLAEEFVAGDARFLLGPSTCLQLVHTHPLPEHNVAVTPLGYRVIELRDDGTVEADLVWL